METPEVTPGLDALGEDLLLLAIKPNGTVGSAAKIDYGLMGSELVRLAAAGRVDIVGDRIIVHSADPTGDPELDGALGSVAAARKPPRPKHWVGHPRQHIRDAYLSRLVSAGALSPERGGLFGQRRYRVADEGRVAAARARLDAIAQSQGPVDVTSAAVGGLAHAVGLDQLLYPGFGARPLRKRLTEIAAGKWTAPAPAGTSVTAAAAAVSGAATDAAVAAATNAAMQAATDAAVQAAVQAATAAATEAAVHAAHDAGAHASGGAGGGHH
jgi:Golgi phosphoprotein 3 (GPP34)